MIADRRPRTRRAGLVLIRCGPTARQASLARRMARRVARLFARPLRPVPLPRPVPRPRPVAGSLRSGSLRLALFALVLAAGLLLSAAFLSWTALHGTRPRGGIGDPLLGWSHRPLTDPLPAT